MKIYSFKELDNRRSEAYSFAESSWPEMGYWKEIIADTASPEEVASNMNISIQQLNDILPIKDCGQLFGIYTLDNDCCDCPYLIVYSADEMQANPELIKDQPQMPYYVFTIDNPSEH